CLPVPVPEHEHGAVPFLERIQPGQQSRHVLLALNSFVDVEFAHACVCSVVEFDLLFASPVNAPATLERLRQRQYVDLCRRAALTTIMLEAWDIVVGVHKHILRSIADVRRVLSEDGSHHTVDLSKNRLAGLSTSCLSCRALLYAHGRD